MKRFIYEKWSEKSNLSIRTSFMHVKATLFCCLYQNMIKHYLRSQMSLNFEPLVQNGLNPSGCSCISPTHSFFIVMIMHHIVHCIDCVSSLFVGACPLSVDVYQRTILSSEVPGKQNPLVHSDTIPLSRSCSLLLH